MNKNEFNLKFEKFKKDYEGEHLNCLELDNLVQEKFPTKDSIFDSNYNIKNLNFSYYIDLDDDDFAWLTIAYDIGAEGPDIFDKELLIKEIYLD